MGSADAFYKRADRQDEFDLPRKSGLESPFAFYPAQTWPHKNHVRLSKAVAHFAMPGWTVRLVCTGTPYKPFWPRIEACIRELKLEAQVSSSVRTGEGPAGPLSSCSVSRSSHAVRGRQLSDYEAWSEGLPVASSSATAMPDQVPRCGPAVRSPGRAAIANALARWPPMNGRTELGAGLRRVKDFGWERTAKAYRAVFRRAAEAPLTERTVGCWPGTGCETPREAMELIEVSTRDHSRCNDQYIYC